MVYDMYCIRSYWMKIIKLNKMKEKNRDKTIYVDFDAITRYNSLEDMLFKYPKGERLNRFWCNRDHISSLLKNLSTSYYYRHLIKWNDAKDVVKLLREDAPSLASFISSFAIEQSVRAMKEEMGHFTIVCLPCGADLVFYGHVYHGIMDICACSRQEDSFILSESERFPCFDSLDYASEDRYYRNYCICNQDNWKEKNELFYANRRLIGRSHSVSEQLAEGLLPMVFYEDEANTMLVAMDYDTELINRGKY